MSLIDAVCEGLELALNRYLALDPRAMEQLSALQGRVICIELLGLGLRLYLVPGPAGMQVLSRFEGEPDCTLRGTPLALAQMGSSRESADQLFSGNVEIQGDSELGHRFGQILGGLDIDWEEHLSRFTGDPIAHEVGNGVRGLGRWGRRTLAHLGLDLQEYLQEELRLLPSRPEIEGFLGDVDTLRDDVERLDARLLRLTRQRSPDPDAGAIP